MEQMGKCREEMKQIMREFRSLKDQYEKEGKNVSE